MKTKAVVKFRLNEILAEREMTQAALIKLAGLSQPTISGLAHDPRMVRMDSLAKLCKALDLQPGDLFQLVNNGK
jgi:DNA-binding Xre family transcriptional regulator